MITLNGIAAAMHAVLRGLPSLERESDAEQH